MEKAIKLLAVMTLLGAGVTGCATTSKTQKVAGAPITYKISQDNVQLTALDLPSRPSASVPFTGSAVPSTPYVPAPVVPQGRIFDQSQVDTQLYKHQRVGKTYTIMDQSYTPKHQPGYNVVGQASWYGPNFHGKPTATGETFNKRDLTAAHPTLPLNSMLFVTNLENGRTLMVRLNDRGPFAKDRIIDLSEASAEALGMKHQGTAQVRVQYAGPADPMASQHTLPKRAPRPAPMPQERLEENIVEAPAAPQYVPYQPEVAPAPPFRPEFETPSTPAPIAPGSPERLPESDLPSGGDVTLIIKGPIHVAKADEADKPQWIAERAETSSR
jgi:rare lipoprotein A